MGAIFELAHGIDRGPTRQAALHCQPVLRIIDAPTSREQAPNPSMHTMQTRKVCSLLVLFLAGCLGIPDNVKPVDNFQLERYLGQWYEIARLDHSFEKGLSRVSAEYSLREDGGVRVLNRGYSARDGAWKEVEGKAYFVSEPDQGYLKVSFFGPFYGSYVLFELDHADYSYAMVAGPNKSCLWILARAPAIDGRLQRQLLDKAAGLGFDTGQLIFVDHTAPDH